MRLSLNRLRVRQFPNKAPVKPIETIKAIVLAMNQRLRTRLNKTSLPKRFERS